MDISQSARLVQGRSQRLCLPLIFCWSARGPERLGLWGVPVALLLLQAQPSALAVRTEGLPCLSVQVRESSAIICWRAAFVAVRVCSSYVQRSFAWQGPRMMRGPARPFEHMAPAFAGVACRNIRALERGRAWPHAALQRALKALTASAAPGDRAGRVASLRVRYSLALSAHAHRRARPGTHGARLGPAESGGVLMRNEAVAGCVREG